MHIYIHSFIGTYATNFTPRCLTAISIRCLPSKQSEAINRHLAMNELHIQLPEKPWKDISVPKLASAHLFSNLSAMWRKYHSISTKCKVEIQHKEHSSALYYSHYCHCAFFLSVCSNTLLLITVGNHLEVICSHDDNSPLNTLSRITWE